MLVLTRKIGERIVLTIGGVQCTVEFLGMNRHEVRLGFEAPPEVVILREEIMPKEEEPTT